MTKRQMPSEAQRNLLEPLRDYGVTPATTRDATLAACYRAGWITSADFPREITALGRDVLRAEKQRSAAE